MKETCKAPDDDPGKGRVNVYAGLLVGTWGLMAWGGCFVPPAMAEGGGPATCRYDLFIAGDDVGDITTTRFWEPGNRLRLKTISEIRITGWWRRWHLASSEEVIGDRQGVSRFDHSVTEDGETWRISGKRRNQALWCRARKVLSKSDSKNQAAADLPASADGVANGDIAPTPVDRPGGANTGAGDLRIPLDHFETTVGELPSYLLLNEAALEKKPVRVLDTMELEIKSVVFEATGLERLRLAGAYHTCHKFNATFEDGSSTYWIARDAAGAFLVKETGQDEDSRYEIRLKAPHKPSTRVD